MLTTSVIPSTCCPESAGVIVYTHASNVAALVVVQKDSCDCLCAGSHCACHYAGSVADLADCQAGEAACSAFPVANAGYTRPPPAPQNELLRPPRA